MNEFLKSYLGTIMPESCRLEIGEEIAVLGTGEPRFTVKIIKEPKKSKLLTSTSLALGEAYMDGEIQVDGDLYETLDCLLANMKRFRKNNLRLRPLLRTSLGRENQRQEVTSHYDIGNDFYELWLDDTMSYSCGYFKHETDSLDAAQVQKVDHILEKLRLRDGMTLLDIGCGWGFLLLRAAKQYGVKGTGITLSKEQHDKFQETIKKEGLEDQLTVKLMDYRDLKSSGMKFDRVTSVGMLEHVGRGNYETFLENVDGILKEEGLFLLHYISGQEESSGDPWIKKYIFPGGVIPSLREIVGLLPEYHFYTLDVESLRMHYNRTLLCWLENFSKCKDQVVKQKGERFARMWELYLASCAAAFHNGIVDLHQILISKGVNNDLDPVRPV